MAKLKVKRLHSLKVKHWVILRGKHSDYRSERLMGWLMRLLMGLHLRLH